MMYEGEDVLRVKTLTDDGKDVMKMQMRVKT